MREKLIEFLQQSFEKQYKKRGLLIAKYTADDLLANGVTVGETVTKCQQLKWIPVTERLPTREDAPRNESILAINKYDRYARMWDWDCVARYPQEYTHWMPLPEPPKEGE